VIRGDGEVVLEEVRPVGGVSRPARAGVLMFEPSEEDRRRMRSTVLGRLRDAEKQLSAAQDVRIVVFDVRRSHIDSYTLYYAVNGYIRGLGDVLALEGTRY
jgi:hypothetical protein